MIEAMPSTGEVFSLLLGFLAGRFLGAAYFAALLWSVRRIEKGGAYLVATAAARLVMIVALMVTAVALGIDALPLGAAAVGFFLARRAAIAPLLGTARGEP